MSAENKGNFSLSVSLLSPPNRPVNMMDRSKERGDFESEADFRNFMIAEAEQNKRTSDSSVVRRKDPGGARAATISFVELVQFGSAFSK